MLPDQQCQTKNLRNAISECRGEAKSESLGAEIALAAFRRHGRLRDAAFLGLDVADRRELLEQC